MTISYEPRDEIDWDGNTSTIPYLVKPNSANGYILDGDNGDDGEFAFTFHSSQQLRKPYYQATAFNGVDIPNDQFTVFGVSDGLYDTLSGPSSRCNISVNDFSQRGTSKQMASHSQRYTLEIVDVLPPYMILKDRDGKMGLLEMIRLLFMGLLAMITQLSTSFLIPGIKLLIIITLKLNYNRTTTSSLIRMQLPSNTLKPPMVFLQNQ